MMYSDIDLKNAIDEGQLKISPFSPKMLKAAGVTLHLGEELLIPESGRVIDMKAGSPPNHEQRIITDDSPYPLKPGDFVLGATYELVTVGPNLGFFIEGRSTLARLGLTIVQTAMLVYPGHENRAVTLELANHGPNTVLLYPKMKIARVAIIELKTPSSYRYDESGKYRNQEQVGPPIFEKEFKEE